MKNRKPCDRARVRRRPRSYHPQLLALEDRLPLGDAVLGALLASSLVAPGLAILDGVASDEWRVASEPGSGCSLATRTTPFSALEADQALPFSRPFFSFRETLVEAQGRNATQGTERPLLGEAARISLPDAAALAALAAVPVRVPGSGLFSSDRVASGLVPVVEQQVQEVGLGQLPPPSSAAEATGSSFAAPGLGLALGEAASRANPPAPAAGHTPPNESLVRQTYAQMPLSFEFNQGQTNPQVRFLSHGSGYSLLLTGTEAVLALSQPAARPGADISDGTALGRGLLTMPPPRPWSGDHRPAREATSAVVRMQVLGGNAAPQVVGRDELPGKVNYFLGNDPSQWHANIPTYARVEYQQVYAGIDLVYYGRQGQLEYDFVVQPGADPATIRLGFTGAEQMGLDAQGNLVLHTSGGSLDIHKPFTYQEVNGLRQEIASTYVLEGQHQVGFRVGAHDPARALVIDPTLRLSSYLGGNGSTNAGQGIAVSPTTGYAYVTGYTDTLTGWLSPTATYGPAGGLDAAFVTQLCPTSASACGGAPAFLWTTFFGGSITGSSTPSYDSGNAIAVDNFDSSYVTGITNSTNFPLTPPPLPCCLVLGGTANAFVVELDSLGGLVYSTYLGGNGTDAGQGIAVDPSIPGVAYVTGSTTSTNFPTTIPPSTPPGQHAFVTKVNTSSSVIVWSRYLGGSGSDWGNGIALNPGGGFYNDLYVTGKTNSPPGSWPTGSLPPGTVTSFGTPGSPNTYSAFVTLLDFTSGVVEDSVYFGGGPFDVSGQAIAVKVFGCVTGYTNSPYLYTTPGAYQPTPPGVLDNAFVACFDELPHALDGSTYLGGENENQGLGIAIPDIGGPFHVYVTGLTSSANFPLMNFLSCCTSFPASPVDFDAFVAEFSNVFLTTTSLTYSTPLGVADFNAGYAIAWDHFTTTDVFVTGATNSLFFPVNGTLPAPQPSLSGPLNAFVAQIM